MAKNFYSIHDLANELDVSSSTIYRWVREGKLPSFDQLGNTKKVGYNLDNYAKILGMNPECMV